MKQRIFTIWVGALVGGMAWVMVLFFYGNGFLLAVYGDEILKLVQLIFYPVVLISVVAFTAAYLSK